MDAPGTTREPVHSGALPGADAGVYLGKLLENGPVGVYSTTPDGRILYASPALVRMLGYSSFAELAQRNLERQGFEPTYSRSDFRRRLEAAGELLGMEAAWQRRDGTTLCVREHAWVVRDHAGRVTRYEGTVEDITDRKQIELELREARDRLEERVRERTAAYAAAQAALHESAGFLRATLDSLAAHIAILDETGTIIAVNRAWREFALAERLPHGDAAVGVNYLQVCDQVTGPDGRQAAAAAAAIRATLAGSPPEEALEYPCHSPTVQRWFALRVTRFEQHGVGRAVVTHENITARRLAEAALRASEERYRRIVETAQEGVFTVDAAAHITFANARLLELVGFGSDEVVGRPFSDFVAPPSRATVALKLQAGWHGPAGHAEVLLQRRDGQVLTALLSTSALPNESGGPGGVLGMVTDITEYRRTQEQLQRVVRLASLGTLAAGIAHEINNPIGGVLMAARAAQDAPSGSPQCRELLDEIITEAKRCAAVIQGLLQFARHGATERWPHDVNELVKRAAELARGAVRPEELHAELVLAPGLPPVPLHAIALEQALLNLIRNAVEAGGSQTLVRIRTEAGPGDVRITIEDNGPGIAPEVLTRIFDPFFTMRAGRGGTGLGLSVVHSIVEAHEGQIEVTSTPGRGTTFRITLPCVGDGGGRE